ncbi:hypothetical protein F2Q68_00032280 [Brassica cretica]|uniref:Uncharacterized protein n=1 Tax=Brassica cretica TaxID=69181 RepID=A0A8S9GH16_BRACR|nr:hypothetical protein F2Q68_00032280 [Brassica cretica]
MASLGEIEESNDLVNHVGGVFRYFIVDVVDPGSTPDVARCSRELVSIDISWKFWRRRISRFVVTITTTTTSETEEETFTEDDFKARDGFRLVNHDETLVRDAADVCKKGKIRDGGYLKGRQTHITSKLDLRRWNQSCTGWMSCDNNMTKQMWFVLGQFKSGSWVHERNGFWLVEESLRSRQVSVTETWCTSTKRKLEQGKSV